MGHTCGIGFFGLTTLLLASPLASSSSSKVARRIVQPKRLGARSRTSARAAVETMRRRRVLEGYLLAGLGLGTQPALALCGQTEFWENYTPWQEKKFRVPASDRGPERISFFREVGGSDVGKRHPIIVAVDPEQAFNSAEVFEGLSQSQRRVFFYHALADTGTDPQKQADDIHVLCTKLKLPKVHIIGKGGRSNGAEMYAAQPHESMGTPLSLILWGSAPDGTVAAGLGSEASPSSLIKTMRITEPQSKCEGGDEIRESYLQDIIAFLDEIDEVEDVPQREGYKQYSSARKLA